MKRQSVTALIPSYNAGARLHAAVKSALSQTHAPEQVIVVDNGSTDGSIDGLRELSDSICVVSEPRRGAAAARNAGVDAARGHYIAFLDADDLWMPYHLELAVSELVRHPAAYALYGGTALIVAPSGSRTRMNNPGRVGGAAQLLFANHLTTSAVVMTTALRSQIRFRRGLPRNEDMLYWVEALASGAMYCYSNIPSVFYIHRPWSIGYRRPLVADVMTIPLLVGEMGFGYSDLVGACGRATKRWMTVACRHFLAHAGHRYRVPMPASGVIDELIRRALTQEHEPL